MKNEMNITYEISSKDGNQFATITSMGNYDLSKLKLNLNRNLVRRIETDSDNNEYFTLPNIYTTDRKFSFSDHIKDAITAVKEGLADAVTSYSIFNVEMIQVRYYLDREIGNNYRNKTLIGWDNTKFGNVILYNNRKIDNTNMITSIFDSDIKPMYFDSAEDATIQINKYIDEANTYLRKYIENPTDHNSIYNELEEKYPDNFNFHIVVELFFDMIDQYKKDNKINISTLPIKVAQAVLY